MKHFDKAATKYFDRHAHPAVHRIAEQLPAATWDRVVLVPAKAETGLLDATIPSIRRSSQALNLKSLLILHVNAAVDSSEHDHLVNQDCLRSLKEGGTPLTPVGDGHFLISGNALDVLVIDSATPPHHLLPKKSGVGLARKIAADLAALLIYQRRVRSPVFYSTDADAIVPQDYFAQGRWPAEESPAGVFAFKHLSTSSDPQERLACELYDQYLRYYVGGLAFAESPYAFQTIGSLLILRADSYIHVRGFTDLLAGEDFYLLNKLAKLGPVQSLCGEPILLSGRVSVRAPFGTGNSIRLYLNQLRSNQEIEYYHPDVFCFLRDLLAQTKMLAIHRDLNRWLGSLQTPAIRAWVDTSKMGAAFDHALKSTRRTDSLQRQLLTWFDGFRTLKAVHFWRDRFVPSIPWTIATRKAPWMNLRPGLYKEAWNPAPHFQSL